MNITKVNKNSYSGPLIIQVLYPKISFNTETALEDFYNNYACIIKNISDSIRFIVITIYNDFDKSDIYKIRSKKLSNGIVERILIGNNQKDKEFAEYKKDKLKHLVNIYSKYLEELDKKYPSNLNDNNVGYRERIFNLFDVLFV